jgi:hypothetical protein
MDNPKVRVRRTKKYGHGVCAIADIRKGEVIAQFDGPFSDESFEAWTDELREPAASLQAGP